MAAGTHQEFSDSVQLDILVSTKKLLSVYSFILAVSVWRKAADVQCQVSHLEVDNAA
jgi:hypothetical protein